MNFDPFIETGCGNELDSKLSEIPGQKKKTCEPVTAESTDETGEESEEPHEYATSEEVIEALGKAFKENKNLDTIIFYVTLVKIRYYFFSDTIRGQDANDVLHDVIEKIISGKRRWNKSKVPNIVEFVFMVIHSHVRNERKKTDNEALVEDFDDVEKLTKQNLVELIRETTRQDSFDEVFKQTYEELIDKYLTLLEDDINGYFVFDEILKGEKSNVNIASNLLITVNDVVNAKRRIKSLINKTITTKK